MQCNTTLFHWVDQLADCRLWNVYSSSIAMQTCRILAGTYTRCSMHRSRASQACSMRNMFGEHAGHAKAGPILASKNCEKFLQHNALSCYNMGWCFWMYGTTMDLRILSQYLCAFKLPSVKCTSVLREWPHNHHGQLNQPQWHQKTHLTTWHHTRPDICPEPVRYRIHLWREHLSNVPDSIKCEHLMLSGTNNELVSGQDPNEDSGHAGWSSLMWFLNVYEEILWLSKPIVSAAA